MCSVMCLLPGASAGFISFVCLWRSSLCCFLASPSPLLQRLPMDAHDDDGEDLFVDYGDFGGVQQQLSPKHGDAQGEDTAMSGEGVPDNAQELLNNPPSSNA